ncbi:MAG: MarR family transcriptional regulator, partial [Acidobacteria bacterium]|nr:MarR family transcriptional regulator [Acidobacteriota bacterium]
MYPLADRHGDKIRGVISCYDRILIQGTLPGICYAGGMTRFLYEHEIRIFDYTTFAEPLRDRIRDNAQRLAREAGLEIHHIRKASIRKEALVEERVRARGTHPGLVAILSAMEACASYKPWHDKATGRTFLKPDSGKCLHYYFYFIDEELGLGHVRVPTWCPFRLQVHFNGHHLLAAKLKQAGITCRMLDNAFLDIGDFAHAQALSDHLDVARLHTCLDRWAARVCPVTEPLDTRYHWSILQAEYATDLLFTDRAALQPLYDHLVRTAIHTVKPEQVATFLGRKLDPRLQAELGGSFSTRIEGTCVKHYLGPAAIKIYDKHGLMLRVETTVNDVSFFKHHRLVEQRNGQEVFKLAPLKKNIYSLPVLDGLCRDANRRYLEFLAAIDDPSAGRDDLDRVSTPRRNEGRSYRGINFFTGLDQRLLLAVSR